MSNILWNHARDVAFVPFFRVRLPLFCVPVPGLCPWAMPRNQERQEEPEEGEPENVAAAAAAGGGLPKRRREDGAEGAGGEGEDAMDCTVGAVQISSYQIMRSDRVLAFLTLDCSSTVYFPSICGVYSSVTQMCSAGYHCLVKGMMQSRTHFHVVVALYCRLVGPVVCAPSHNVTSVSLQQQ